MSNGPAPKTSSLAIAALVFTFLCMPVGLILGIVALVRIGKSNGELGGKGLALAAVIISGAMVPISGILAAIAIPNFVRYQNRAKAAEARANLGAIRASQQMRYADVRRYLAAEPAGGAPNDLRMPWDAAKCSPACPDDPSACRSFDCLEFQPYGHVYFRYACNVTPAGDNFTCAALGDLDGDGVYSLFVVQGEDGAAAPVPDFDGRSPGCPGLEPGQVVDCAPGVY